MLAAMHACSSEETPFDPLTPNPIRYRIIFGEWTFTAAQALCVSQVRQGRAHEVARALRLHGLSHTWGVTLAPVQAERSQFGPQSKLAWLKGMHVAHQPEPPQLVQSPIAGL